MALFTDGAIVTTEDLRSYESSVLDVAKGEGIDLRTKGELAQREIGADLYRYLVDLTATELAPPTVQLTQIVVTEELFQWTALRTLELTFRDAFHNELNDRYKAKWQEYERQAARAQARVFEIGPGVVEAPVGKAEQPVVAGEAGVMPSGIFPIQVAWVSASGKSGAPSEAVLFTSEDGRVPRVTVGTPPANGVAWNVYAGPLGGTPELQNTAPIAASDDWTAPTTGFVPGAAVAKGQQPDYFLRRLRTL